MPNVGERWKFAQSDVDFTITRIENDRVYYIMNWPEHARQPYVEYNFVCDDNGKMHIEALTVNPMSEQSARIESFSDGTLVKSNV